MFSGLKSWQLTGWQGLLILAPLWTTFFIVLYGFLHPGYSHISQHISELAATGAPYGRWMSYLGLLPFGLLLLPAAFKLIIMERRTRVAYGFFGISSLCFVFVGIFPCDLGCPWRNVSLGADIHNLSALTAFLTGLCAQLFLGSLYLEKRHNGYYRSCLILGLLSVFLYILVDLSSIPYGHRGLLTYQGLMQRAFMTNYFLWLILTALKLAPRKTPSRH